MLIGICSSVDLPFQNQHMVAAQLSYLQYYEILCDCSVNSPHRDIQDLAADPSEHKSEQAHVDEAVKEALEMGAFVLAATTLHLPSSVQMTATVWLPPVRPQ